VDTFGTTYALAFEKRALIPTSLLVRTFTAGLKTVGARQAMGTAVRSTLKNPGVTRALTGAGPKTGLITGLMKQRGLKFGPGIRGGTPAAYRGSGGRIAARWWEGIGKSGPPAGRPGFRTALSKGTKKAPTHRPLDPKKLTGGSEAVGAGAEAGKTGWRPGWGTVGLAGLGGYMLTRS
jgi:hypothetical protein